MQIVDTGSPIIMISPVENQAHITEATIVQEWQVQDAGAQVDPYDHGISPQQIIENSDYRASTGFRSLSNDFGTTIVGFNTHSTSILAQFDKDTRRDENKHFGYLVNYKFQSDEDCSSDEHLVMMVLFYLHLMKIAVKTCYVTNLGLRLQRPNEARPTSTEKGKETRSSPSTTPQYTPDLSPECSSLALQTMDTGSLITMISLVENQANISEATIVQESQVQNAGVRVDPHDHGISPQQIIGNSDYRASTGFRSLSYDFGMTIMGFNTHSTSIPAQSNNDTRRDENKHFGYLVNYKFQSDEDCSSDEHLVMMVLFYLHLRTPRYII